MANAIITARLQQLKAKEQRLISLPKAQRRDLKQLQQTIQRLKKWQKTL